MVVLPLNGQQTLDGGWDLGEVKEFEREHAFRRVYFDGCMLGVHGKECPIRKPWCVSSCDERILTIMAAYQCDHSHQHEPAEGSQTKQTGFDILHKTIRIGYRRSIVCSKMVSTCSRSQHFLCTCDIESDKVATVQGWKGNQSHQSGSRRFESQWSMGHDQRPVQPTRFLHRSWNSYHSNNAGSIECHALVRMHDNDFLCRLHTSLSSVPPWRKHLGDTALWTLVGRMEKYLWSLHSPCNKADQIVVWCCMVIHNQESCGKPISKSS